MTLPIEFRDPLARCGDRLGAMASRVVWYQSITSTNDAASSLAEAGASEGTAVIAETQTAGRGRLGRVWISPPGAGLYASVILRPPNHVLALLTITVGVALGDGIRAATGLETTVKWPNDIQAGRRKLAGVLAEAGTSGAGVPHVVVGFGINVLPAAYPEDIAARATSVESELGRPVDRGLLFAECLAGLASRYRDLCNGGGAAIVAEWRRRAAATFGRPVEWDTTRGQQRGIADGVDDSGALLVRTAAGRERVISGEVRWTS